ncbi:putative plant intracellular Ras-group-related LRR protein 4-like [Salvia divinorum]|uniref:Plant intracellular Ras-group-related LRR protein 4-like n=1 Tax=Salvia divinorum TaxID=28513 RepID=A0ABD1GCK1_SALDI
MGCCLVYRVLVVAVLCVAFLSAGLETVSGLRSKDLALRRGRRILNGDDALLDRSSTQLDIAPSPSTVFDPNESQKRRVRRRPDPIHNKC